MSIFARRRLVSMMGFIAKRDIRGGFELTCMLHGASVRLGPWWVGRTKFRQQRHDLAAFANEHRECEGIRRANTEEEQRDGS